MKLSNIILLLFCALSISLNAQEKIPKKARKLFEEYKEAIRYNDFPKAISSLEKAIEIVKKRYNENKNLYKNLYNFDFGENLSVFDKIIETDGIDAKQVLEVAKSTVRELL